MHDQRPHRHYSTSADDACRRGDDGGEVVNLALGEHAASVRTRQDAEGSVGSARVIQVHAHGEDGLQDRGRRAAVQRAALD